MLSLICENMGVVTDWAVWVKLWVWGGKKGKEGCALGSGLFWNVSEWPGTILNLPFVEVCIDNYLDNSKDYIR